MSNKGHHVLIDIFHTLLRCVVGLGIFVAILLCVLAYGFDGRFFQKYIDAAMPSTIGRLTIQHIAYRPNSGIILKGVHLATSTGKCLMACTQVVADFQILSRAPLQDRLKSLILDELFVAQLQHDPNKPPSKYDDPHDPFPDLSTVRLPKFDNVEFSLLHPNILEINLQSLQGKVSTRGGSFFFHDIKSDVDGQREHVIADLEVNIHEGYVDTHIRGELFPRTIYGVYRALDFPILETYSSKFKLENPLWVDCTFKVGLDKYRNIFNLCAKLNLGKGNYCGVAFDNVQGTIRCTGIWDATTTIEPLIISRNNKVIATGKMDFNCLENKFSFESNSEGLMPAEALQLIDMPFTQVIPTMTAEVPPTMHFRGNIPLLTEQAPSHVILSGSLISKSPLTFDRIKLKSAETQLSMQQGIFSIDTFKGELPSGGTLDGRVNIYIPDTALYTDILTDINLKRASLADLLAPFHMETLTNCVATGNVTFSCRTDETFSSSINSTFDVKVDGGVIGRVPLFAGFTDIIADNIPGVSTITDTSIVDLKGSAKNGIFTLPHFMLSGSLFMIEGPVTYDLPKDDLHADIIAGIFKKDTLVGTLTRWATIPVTKMLWEVEVTGPIAKPAWKNKTIINKLWDYVPFTGDEKTRP